MSKLKKPNLKNIFYFVKPLALPVLLAILPSLYHYSNNVAILLSSSLSKLLILNLIIAVFLYLVFSVFHKFRSTESANTTFVFLIFFNVYGLVYRYLLRLDIIRIEHYTLLPLVLMMAIYSILAINKLKKSISVGIWKYLTIILGILVIFNILTIIPGEFKKLEDVAAPSKTESQLNISTSEEYPDIYYILLDEFAGFQAMREYWGYTDIEKFVDFLKAQEFFVAEKSHGSSTDTLYEMATRLNYKEYPNGSEHTNTYFNAIADNRVMSYLKARGYTTVVFDETSLSYPSSKSISADYLYEYGSSSIPQSGAGAYGFYFDEFGELVMDNTMLYVVSEKYKKIIRLWINIMP